MRQEWRRDDLNPPDESRVTNQNPLNFEPVNEQERSKMIFRDFSSVVAATTKQPRSQDFENATHEIGRQIKFSCELFTVSEKAFQWHDTSANISL